MREKEGGGRDLSLGGRGCLRGVKRCGTVLYPRIGCMFNFANCLVIVFLLMPLFEQMSATVTSCMLAIA